MDVDLLVRPPYENKAVTGYGELPVNENDEI